MSTAHDATSALNEALIFTLPKPLTALRSPTMDPMRWEHTHGALSSRRWVLLQVAPCNAMECELCRRRLSVIIMLTEITIVMPMLFFASSNELAMYRSITMRGHPEERRKEGACSIALVICHSADDA